MTEQPPFTIEQFCKHAGQGKMLGGKCRKCGRIQFPPRPLCDNCLSKDFKWVEIPSKGKLLTYTIIYVAPAQFQQMAPYAVGIVELEKGLRLPGMIRDAALDRIRIDMPLTLEFEACQPTTQWPQWPRYHFKPV
jgi:hypothetical protein